MGRPLVVVFLVDALGWEIAERFDFAGELLTRRAPLDTVLGYSSAAIPSLLSGTTPQEHGSWSMYRISRGGTSPFFGLRWIPPLPHPLEWRVRRLVRAWLERRGSIAGYYDLYDIPVHLLSRLDVAQRQDAYLPGGLSRETLFDVFEKTPVPYRLWYHKTAEVENMNALLESMNEPYDVLFLYTAELDALMHRVGTAHASVGDRLATYERFIIDVLAQGQACDRQVSLYLFSDHGMTDVTRVVDVRRAFERSGLTLGRDYMGFFDSTMARLWCDARVERIAADAFANVGAGRLLTRSELEAYGCYFADGSYGTSILVADPGVIIVPSFMGREPVAAMHGYDPSDAHSCGCFLTNDPARNLPGSILDIKRFLCDATGASGAGERG